jgi:hypothetical protein
MTVRIVRNYDYPNIFRQTPSESGIWNNTIFTESPIEECDYLVVFNSPPEALKVRCTEGGAWLFSQESPIPIYTWHTKSFSYFDKVYSFWDKSIYPNVTYEQTSLPWHINKNYDFLKSLTFNDVKKSNRVSWITSNATDKPGHKLRMAFKDSLIEHRFDFDLLGKGIKPISDKFDALSPYKYSIAIENYACDGYWTEKIADCFLSWTMPIYYGCTDILDYFPKDSLILIDPSNPKESINIIQKAIQSQTWEKNIEAIATARELVLDKYQIFPNIVSKIEEHQRTLNVNNNKKELFIPANCPPIENISYLTRLKRKLTRLWSP